MEASNNKHRPPFTLLRNCDSQLLRKRSTASDRLDALSPRTCVSCDLLRTQANGRRGQGDWMVPLPSRQQAVYRGKPDCHSRARNVGCSGADEEYIDSSVISTRSRRTSDSNCASHSRSAQTSHQEIELNTSSDQALAAPSALRTRPTNPEVVFSQPQRTK